MSNHEFKNPNPSIENLVPELRYTECIGDKPSMAWQLNATGERMPDELTLQLAQLAQKGTTVLMAVEYVIGGATKGVFMSTTGASEGGLALQFAEYDATVDGKSVKAYADSDMLGLGRLQQDEISGRFINWLSSITVNGETRVPSTHTEFMESPVPVIVTGARIAAALDSPDQKAEQNQEFNLESMRQKIAEYVASQVEAPSAVHEPSTKVAKKGIKRFLRRKK